MNLFSMDGFVRVYEDLIPRKGESTSENIFYAALCANTN